MRLFLSRLRTLFVVWQTNADLKDYGYGRLGPD